MPPLLFGAEPCPGPTHPPLQGGNPQRSSPFLCALFFVLLKSSPPWRWSPPPPRPRRGAGAWAILETQAVRSCFAGGPPAAGRPLIVCPADWGRLALGQMAARRGRGWGAVPPSTPNPLERSRGLTAQGPPFSTQRRRHRGEARAPGPPAEAVGAGQIARGDDQRRKSIALPPLHSPRGERKLPEPGLQTLPRKHQESGSS